MRDPTTHSYLLRHGTGHWTLTLLNPQKIAIVPNPRYPFSAGGVGCPFNKGTILYNALALLAKTQFLPTLTDILTSVLAKARLMVLNYPDNPTTAMAFLSFFEKIVKFCQQHDLVLVHDFPYADIVFDRIKLPPFILEVAPNKFSPIKFFTFSKLYNMGGF